MFVTLLTLTIVTLFFVLYLKWIRAKTFWAKKNIPHKPPHPLLGSLTHLQKKNAGEWMRELYTSFNKTPYIGIWLFWKPALVINCPEVARRVLVKDSEFFRDRHLSSGKSDPIGGLNIFTANDPLWSSVRRRLTSVFTSAKLKTFQPLMLAKSKELCQRIQMEIQQKNDIDLRNIFTDYTTDIVGEASFGVKCTATLTGDCAMRRVTRDFQTFTFYRGLAHTCIFFLPEAIDWFRFSFFPKNAENYFRKIFQTIVKQRGGFDKPVEESRDLVDALIKMKQDAIKDNKPMSMDLLTSQAAIMVQGGFETSAANLTFTAYELAYCPEAQDKLYEELKEIKQNLGDKDFDMDSLADAKYLNAVTKETLRKYPPMGYIDRISSKEYKFDETLTIPAGTPCYVNAVAMQVDSDYFPEPEKFIPERFMPENEKDIKPFTYLPFGEGPRNCIGRRFAHQTIRFALAQLVMQYKLVPKPGQPLPNECQLEKLSHFLLPGEVLSVDFVPRN